jgi:hypothetical protein
MTENYFAPMYFDPVTRVWVVTFKVKSQTVITERRSAYSPMTRHPVRRSPV